MRTCKCCGKKFEPEPIFPDTNASNYCGVCIETLRMEFGLTSLERELGLASLEDSHEQSNC